MSLGSPALAAYSLVLTSLNAQSVYRRVKASRSRYKKSVMEALISIQQTSLELTKDERLLEFIQDNHRWREEIGERLSRRGIWSLATATSVAWVVIAFLLTLVDSFVSLDGPVDHTAGGHAVGTAWLWLLCLVVGWMWVPIFDSGEIKTALDSANQRAVKRAAKRIKRTGEAAKRFMSLARDKIANRPAQGVGNRGNIGDARQEPDQNTNLSVGRNGGEDGLVDRVGNPAAGDTGQKSGQNVNPRPNLGGRKGTDRVDSIVAGPSFTQDEMDPETDQLLISKDLGSLNRDERRLSATFNYSRAMRYLVLVDDVLKALDKVARREHEVGISSKCLEEVVSMILNRRRSLPLETFPLCPRRRRLCSLGERSAPCSVQRLWPSFSSAEQLLEP